MSTEINAVKEVKSFSEDSLPSYTFVATESPTGGYELTAFDKQTGTPSERLLRKFSTLESLGIYVKKLISRI